MNKVIRISVLITPRHTNAVPTKSVARVRSHPFLLVSHPGTTHLGCIIGILTIRRKFLVASIGPRLINPTVLAM